MKFEEQVLNRYGPAQVGFGLLPESSPFMWSGINPPTTKFVSPAAHARIRLRPAASSCRAARDVEQVAAAALGDIILTSLEMPLLGMTQVPRVFRQAQGWSLHDEHELQP